MCIRDSSKAMEFMENEYPEQMPICINLRANSPPFHKSYLFDDSLLSAVTLSFWYRSLKEKLDEKVIYKIVSILSATSSNANVERVFSTFRLVHSNIRNRLGTAKAGKLVFFL